MLRYTLVFAISAILMAGCDALTDLGSPSVMTVIIDTEDFQDYPAAWFSSLDGSTHYVESETPPADKYDFWVEPRDPEFALRFDVSPGSYGAQFVGTGLSAFEGATSVPGTGYLARLPTDVTWTDRVVALRTPNGESVILIEELDQANHSIEFRWKRLD